VTVYRHGPSCSILFTIHLSWVGTAAMSKTNTYKEVFLLESFAAPVPGD